MTKYQSSEISCECTSFALKENEFNDEKSMPRDDLNISTQHQNEVYNYLDRQMPSMQMESTQHQNEVYNYVDRQMPSMQMESTQHHILETNWNYPRIEQIIGRAHRSTSHLEVPEAQGILFNGIHVLDYGHIMNYRPAYSGSHTSPEGMNTGIMPSLQLLESDDEDSVRSTMEEVD